MAKRKRAAVHDDLVDHLVDVQRFAKGEAKIIRELLAKEDAALVKLLRQRLPNLAKSGDLRAARTKKLLRAIRDLRNESYKKLGARVREDLVELAKVEAQAMAAIATKATTTTFAPVRVERLRVAVTQNPFAGGKNAARTLQQWVSGMATNDRQRLLGAVQQSVFRLEPVDAAIRRIAGTKKNGYRDGVLAISRREAEVAVRTAINHTANAAQLEWAKANSNVVIGHEWISTLDERTCPICADLNGGFLPLDDAAPPKGMKEIDQSPPAHPQCRCSIVAVFDFDAMAGGLPDELEEDD